MTSSSIFIDEDISDMDKDTNDADSSNKANDVKESMSLKNRLYLEATDKLAKRNMPNVNSPERIVLCVDLCHNDSSSLFLLGDGTSYTPLNMMKRVTEFFVYSKIEINHKSEFALIVLKDSKAVWCQHFTNNPKDIISKLDSFAGEISTNGEFDLGEIFQLIKDNVHLPIETQDLKVIPPPYVVRLLMIYSRSDCIPKLLSNSDTFDYFKNQLYFTVDILLTHEEECVQHKCVEVYDALQDLDNGYSYVFEVSRNAAKIHDCIAKLLAHPLQRPLQKDTSYTF